jgi:hypothetical protein
MLTLHWADSNQEVSAPAGRGRGAVEDTAYGRISWARSAMRLVAGYPFGTQSSRNALKNLVTRKSFLVAVIRQGHKASHASRQAAGLALLFLTAGFAGRAFLDSILRDPILEEFMFCAGLRPTASSRNDKSEFARDAQ